MELTQGPGQTGSQMDAAPSSGYFTPCRRYFHLQLTAWLDDLWQGTATRLKGSLTEVKVVYISHCGEDKGGRHMSLQLWRKTGHAERQQGSGPIIEGWGVGINMFLEAFWQPGDIQQLLRSVLPGNFEDPLIRVLYLRLLREPSSCRRFAQSNSPPNKNQTINTQKNPSIKDMQDD